MHIGKNVSEMLINTFLGTTEKSKDNLNSRLDLQALGIRSDLHPVEVDDQFYLPPAPYTMSPDEKKLFCEILKGVKFPDGYASNIRHNIHVNEKKIFGLKSHEWHIILQHLLPLAVRKILPEMVSAGVIRISNFFKKLCSPVIRRSDMDSLESDIAETLSLLEAIFPPSFFDIMVDLMVHLPAQCTIVCVMVVICYKTVLFWNFNDLYWNWLCIFPWKNQAKCDIHVDGMYWILNTAGKKWKELEANLKKRYFDDKLTDEQLKKKYGDRVMTVIGSIS